jgi:hypothetical protein
MKTMETKEFKVSVMECNAHVFANNYGKYIVEYEQYYYTYIFKLDAPQNVYDEISGLGEEGIEIL